MSRCSECGVASNGAVLVDVDGAGEENDVEELKRHVRAAGEAIEEQDVDALRRHVRAACKVIGEE